MKHTLEDIRKVDDPEERIRLLREFEKEAREEIKKAEEYSREDKAELERQKRLEGIIIPEPEPLNLDGKFGIEEPAGPPPLQVADSTSVEYTVKKDLERLETFTEYGRLDEHQREEMAKIEGKVSAFKYVNTSREISEMLDASRNIIAQIRKYDAG